jgi:protease-4
VVNILLGGLLVVACLGLMVRGVGTEGGSGGSPTEKHFAGSKTAEDKVAIVSLDGALMDGMLGNLEKQIEQAAKDKHVKAVVFRVNSPGGSISASEDIRQRIQRLRDGDADKERPARPVVVSMGALAASGGYYVSTPGQKILAEPTTLTGSIGVYSSFPDLSGFGEAHKVGFTTIKAGDLKAAGGMFSKMTEKERQVWQDMVDDAYLQFLDVIKQGRPKLTREMMLVRFPVDPVSPDKLVLDPKAPPKPYERYRADGGVYTGKRALELGLVDALGTLEDAVKEAAKLAGMEKYNAVKYQKPMTLTDLLLNSRANDSGGLSPAALGPLLAPRLWYLAPGYEASVRLGEARP